MTAEDSGEHLATAEKRSRPARWLWRGLLVLIGASLAWLWFVWPPPAWYRWNWPKETAFMAMRRHQEPRPENLTRRYEPVFLDAIARVMKDAVLAGEDQRFYTHSGIDYIELRHAFGYRPDSFSWTSAKDRALLWRALRQVWARRLQVRGASTLSQQLAKNLYLSSSRSPLRKLKEAITAWRLEYWLGKERILELYLNVAELGPELWGVEAASRKYFGHRAARLSLEEAAALAGTLPFPLSSNLLYRPGRMRWRQNMIIRRLRGEDVVIPPVLDSLPEILPDTLKPFPDTVRIKRDSLADSLRPKPDTVIDTVPARPPRDAQFWNGGKGVPARPSRRAAAALPG